MSGGDGFGVCAVHRLSPLETRADELDRPRGLPPTSRHGSEFAALSMKSATACGCEIIDR